VLREWAQRMGGVVGEPEAARALLAAGRLVGVAPGGMREALRPARRRYQVDWTGVTVFAAWRSKPVHRSSSPPALAPTRSTRCTTIL